MIICISHETLLEDIGSLLYNCFKLPEISILVDQYTYQDLNTESLISYKYLWWYLTNKTIIIMNTELSVV